MSSHYRFWIRLHRGRYTNGQISTWQLYVISYEGNVNEIIVIHYLIPLEELKLEILTTLNVGEDILQIELSQITGDCIEGYDHFRREFGIFFFLHSQSCTYYTSTLWSINSTHRYLPYKNESLHPHKTSTRISMVPLFIIAKIW